MELEVIEMPEGIGNGKDLNTGRTCNAINTRGEPCSGWAMKNSDYCWVHNPEVSEQRHAARKLGGTTNQAQHSPRVNLGQIPKEIRSIEDLLILLDFCKDEMLMLNNSLNRNKAIVQLAGAYSAVLKDSDLENRLDEINDEFQDLLKKANKVSRRRA